MQHSDSDSWRPAGDHDPLFSRTVKAGKRVYYIDVKRDRRDEYYLALTESKRVQEGSETERPVFEKHKIFLYREDIINFLAALTDAAQYVGEHRPLTAHERRPYTAPERSGYDDAPAPSAPAQSHRLTDESGKIGYAADFDIEF